MKVSKTMDSLQEGEVAEIKATDPGFGIDIAKWCEKTGNTLLSSDFTEKVCTVQIQKCSKAAQRVIAATQAKDGATLVVFSGDLDKAMASYIIASEMGGVATYLGDAEDWRFW